MGRRDRSDRRGDRILLVGGLEKVTDQWEGLFRIWHERAHDDPKSSILNDLLDLERRIVKLEARMRALRPKPPYEVR